MKLSKIKYVSAVFFGVLSLVMYLLLGALQWSLRDALMTQGVSVSALQVFLLTPVVGGIAGYLLCALVIWVYNLVAMKYPIAWEVKK